MAEGNKCWEMEHTSTEHEVSSYSSVAKMPNKAAQIGVYATTTLFKDIPVHDEHHQRSNLIE